MSQHPRTRRRGVGLAGLAGLATAAVAVTTLVPLSAAQAVPTEPVAATYTDPIDPPVEIHSAPAADGDTVATSQVPAGLTVTRSAEGTDPVVWSLTGSPSVDPGTYVVNVQINDGATQEFDVVVAPENATVVSTTPATVATTAGQPATLTATVTPEADGTPGDLTKAKVAFTDTTTGTVLCPTASVAADGTATCQVPATKAAYAVALTVGGSYISPTTTPAPVAVQVAPETTITSGPVDGSIYTSTKATIGYSSSDPAATFVCAIDGKTKPCTAPALKFSNLGKRSHVFTVAAVGADGATDPTPATLSFTVPLDDTSLAPTKAWKRAGSAKAYNGTYLKTTTKAATLTRGVTNATGVSVLVRTEKGAGSLKVFLNGQKVGKLQLAQTGKWRVLPLPGLPEKVTGTIKLVTGGKKPVKVDGLAVVKQS